MFRRIQFPSEIESLVRFVEETPGGRIVPETIAQLRAGCRGEDLLRASVLAAMRSTELSVGHHGGPMHVMCGVFPAYETAQRLSGERAFLPVIQHVALANAHIQAPETGPYLMPEKVPVQAKDVPRFMWKEGFQPGTPVDDTRDAFVRMMEIKEPSIAEGHLLWLLERVPPGEILDLILGHALPLNPYDDHYALFPLYAARALDVIGWEWAPVLFRAVVSWQARNPYGDAHGASTAIDGLLREYGLLDGETRLHGSVDETDAIGQLGMRIGEVGDLSVVPQMVAEALAQGLSMEGAGEAISIGAGTLYLRTDYGNPMDSHLHTGITGRRHLLANEGVSLRNKLIGLLTWSTGPELVVFQDRIDWPSRADAGRLAAFPDRGQTALLGAIEESCRDYPTPADLSLYALFSLRTSPEVRHTMALAEQYAMRGYDPAELFALMARIVSEDSFTEMHALKHHQATVDEYYSVREPFRWVHLVGAAKFAAVTYGASRKVFNAAADVLAI